MIPFRIPDSKMQVIRLHGPRDLRLECLLVPPEPKPGEVLLQVTATAICGSDLHTYREGRVGDTLLASPLVLGHEFGGIVTHTGPQARGGDNELLQPGQKVAVDPAMPCFRCEFCEKGHPNLCRRLQFCGLWPDDGSLREFMIMQARCCFPLPDNFTFAQAALLEPLGIGIHAIDLANLKVEESVAILGAGPIGLMILQVARLSGAHPIFVSDQFPWRLDMARRLGADVTINIAQTDPVAAICSQTAGRGTDVVFEAAWADDSVVQAVEIARLGGRVIVVGIPSENHIAFPASPARRKGLTLKFSRRMKHVYPRAIALVQRGQIDLESTVTHRFSLSLTPEAFALNASYSDSVVKVIIESA